MKQVRAFILLVVYASFITGNLWSHVVAEEEYSSALYKVEKGISKDVKSEFSAYQANVHKASKHLHTSGKIKLPRAYADEANYTDFSQTVVRQWSAKLSVEVTCSSVPLYIKNRVFLI